MYPSHWIRKFEFVTEVVDDFSFLLPLFPG